MLMYNLSVAIAINGSAKRMQALMGGIADFSQVTWYEGAFTSIKKTFGQPGTIPLLSVILLLY